MATLNRSVLIPTTGSVLDHSFHSPITAGLAASPFAVANPSFATANVSVQADSSGDFSFDITEINGFVLRLSVQPYSAYKTDAASTDPSAAWTLTVADLQSGVSNDYAIPAAGNDDATGSRIIATPLTGAIRLSTTSLSADERVRISITFTDDPALLSAYALPSVIGIGDATNYIRLNGTTGKLEYGGTYRPTERFTIMPHYETAGVSLSWNAVGSVEYFNDGSSWGMYWQGWWIPNRVDLTDDIVFTLRLQPRDASIVTSTNDVMRRQWRCYKTDAVGSGTTINNPTAYGIVAGGFDGNSWVDETVPATTQYHQFEITATLPGLTLDTDDRQITIQLIRDATHANDTIGSDLSMSPFGTLLAEARITESH